MLLLLHELRDLLPLLARGVHAGGVVRARVQHDHRLARCRLQTRAHIGAHAAAGRQLPCGCRHIDVRTGCSDVPVVARRCRQPMSCARGVGTRHGRSEGGGRERKQSSSNAAHQFEGARNKAHPAQQVQRARKGCRTTHAKLQQGCRATKRARRNKARALRSSIMPSKSRPFVEGL